LLQGKKEREEEKKKESFSHRFFFENFRKKGSTDESINKVSIN